MNSPFNNRYHLFIEKGYLFLYAYIILYYWYKNNYLLQSSSTSPISSITYNMIYYIIYYFSISYHFIENNIRYNLPLLRVYPPGHRLRCPQRSKHRWLYIKIRDIEDEFFQPFIGSVTSQWALMSVRFGWPVSYNLL